MNSFTELGYPEVATPVPPVNVAAKYKKNDIINHLDLSGGVHFAFKMENLTFIDLPDVANVRNEDYVTINIEFGDSLMSVVNMFPLDKHRNFMFDDLTRSVIEKSNDPEVNVFLDRGVFISKYNAWEKNMQALMMESSKNYSVDLAMTFQSISLRKREMIEATRFHGPSHLLKRLSWMPHYSSSMATPAVEDLTLGQVVRKTHLQHWIEQTLVCLDALRDLGRLGPVTVSLDGEPIADWVSLAPLCLQSRVRKVNTQHAACMGAVINNKVSFVEACPDNAMHVFTTESRNFTVGITALSDTALASDLYRDESNWVALSKDQYSQGVSGLYVGDQLKPTKIREYLNIKAFNALSDSADRYHQKRGLHLGMSCGDFGPPQYEVLRNEQGQTLGVRQILWPEAFDSVHTSSAISSIYNLERLHCGTSLESGVSP